MALIATGYFDGVHLGHRHLLEALRTAALERGEESVVITFHPHPRAVLQKEASSFRLLSSREEKKQLIQSLGIDRVEEIEFTKSFAALTASEYFDFLIREFGCSGIVLGYDNRVGSDGLSSGEIASVAASKGIDIIRPDAVLSGEAEAAVSSTRIRKALESGDVSAAGEMLGRYYPIHGVVVSGNRIGRTIGFPTANIRLYDPLKIVPAGGVYLTRVHVLGRTFWGMTNIGSRPTVTSSPEIVIETNIFDFEEDIYSLEISVEFVRKIRNEVRFEGLESLKEQLSKDKEFCLAEISSL